MSLSKLATLETAALAGAIALVVSVIGHVCPRFLRPVLVAAGFGSAFAAFLSPKDFRPWWVPLYLGPRSSISVTFVQLILAVGLALLSVKLTMRRRWHWLWSVPMGSLGAFAALRMLVAMSIE